MLTNDKIYNRNRMKERIFEIYFFKERNYRRKK